MRNLRQQIPVRLLFWHAGTGPQGFCGNHCFPLAAAGFLAHAAKATRRYSLRQSNLPSDFLFSILKYHWFHKGLQITVRFCDWRQGHDLLGRGSAHGILQNPKEFSRSSRSDQWNHTIGRSLSVLSSNRNPLISQGFIRASQ